MQKRFLLSTQAPVQLSLIIVLVCLSLLISSCGVIHHVQPASSVSSLPVADSADMPEVIRQLLIQADQQFHQEQLQASQATLERALRIHPQQPEIWSRLANISLLQGKTTKAAQYARRSNHFIRNNQRLKQFNDDIISKSLTGQ